MPRWKPGVEATDVADHVREQRAIRIATTEVRHQVDAGIAPAIHREARGFFRRERAQAGEQAIADVVSRAGFTRFRRVAETPFNHVYEVRP